MEANFLYQDILGMLSIIKNDTDKLMAVLSCLENEILGENRVKKDTEISAEYRDTIMQIADSVCNGFINFLNPETMEIEQLQRNTTYDSEEYEELNDDMIDEYGMNYMKWDNYIKFEPPGPTDLIRIMEKFVSQLKNSLIGSKLVNSLEGPTPISSFLRIVEKENCGQEWEQFRKNETLNYVNDILTNKMRTLQVSELA